MPLPVFLEMIATVRTYEDVLRVFYRGISPTNKRLDRIITKHRLNNKGIARKALNEQGNEDESFGKLMIILVNHLAAKFFFAILQLVRG